MIRQLRRTFRLAAGAGASRPSRTCRRPRNPITTSPWRSSVFEPRSRRRSALPFPFMLTARAEIFSTGAPILDDTIRRLQTFEPAGADVLYAPGLYDLATIKTVVSALKKLFNLVMGFADPSLTVPQLSAAGVKRISVGGGIARVALAAFLKCAREMKDQGSFTWVRDMATMKDVRAGFARAPRLVIPRLRPMRRHDRPAPDPYCRGLLSGGFCEGCDRAGPAAGSDGPACSGHAANACACARDRARHSDQHLADFAGPHLRDIMRRLWPLLLGLAVGTRLNAGMMTGPYARYAPIFLGMLLVIYALVSLRKFKFSVSLPNEKWIGGVVGLISGVISAATGVQVIPSMPYLQAIDMERDEFVQALGVFFTVGTLALAFNLTTAGVLDQSTALPGVVALAGSFSGMAIGQAVRTRLAPETFRRWFLISMVWLGSYLVVAGTSRSTSLDPSLRAKRSNPSSRRKRTDGLLRRSSANCFAILSRAPAMTFE